MPFAIMSLFFLVFIEFHQCVHNYSLLSFVNITDITLLDLVVRQPSPLQIVKPKKKICIVTLTFFFAYIFACP